MTTLTWLHLSDLHLRGTETSVDRARYCPSFSIQSTPDSHLLEFAAGASLRADYHAYNLVKLDLDTGKGTLFVRLQHPDFGDTWGKDYFTYGNAKDGKLEFGLALSTSSVATEA